MRQAPAASSREPLGVKGAGVTVTPASHGCGLRRAGGEAQAPAGWEAPSMRDLAGTRTARGTGNPHLTPERAGLWQGHEQRLLLLASGYEAE